MMLEAGSNIKLCKLILSSLFFFISEEIRPPAVPFKSLGQLRLSREILSFEES
jgi:hypothetical protein